MWRSRGFGHSHRVPNRAYSEVDPFAYRPWNAPDEPKSAGSTRVWPGTRRSRCRWLARARAPPLRPEVVLGLRGTQAVDALSTEICAAMRREAGRAISGQGVGLLENGMTRAASAEHFVLYCRDETTDCD